MSWQASAKAIYDALMAEQDDNRVDGLGCAAETLQEVAEWFSEKASTTAQQAEQAGQLRKGQTVEARLVHECACGHKWSRTDI